MVAMPKFLDELWRGFLDFIFPPACHICGVNTENVLCDRCESSISTLDAGYCPTCDSKIHADQSHCPNCRADMEHPVSFVRPLANFDAMHKELIHLLKYSGIIGIAEFFGKRIGNVLRSERHFRDYDMIIPVPLHRHRFRERRYNQAELLARAASAATGIPMAKNIVERTKHTESQTKLSPQERRENVKDAFRVRKPDEIRGRAIIILDDVVTTGATTSEIARKLLDAGAKQTCAVCIAHPMQKESQKFGI